MKLVLVLLLTSHVIPASTAPLYSAGVMISNDNQPGVTVFNTNTLEEIEMSIVGIYEKSRWNVVLRSYDVGTYRFTQSIPYNVSNNDVELSEVSYNTDLTKDTKLIIGANVVRTHGYLPLTSNVDIDQMYKVAPEDVLVYFMVRNWCTSKLCRESQSTLEFRLSVKATDSIKVFRQFEKEASSNETSSKSLFCNESNSSCREKFQNFQLNSCKLAFSNYINCDGGFKFNDYPVKFTDITDRKTKELILTIEMPLNASEILYGPIHLSWQQFYVSSSSQTDFSVSLLFLLFYTLYTPG